MRGHAVTLSDTDPYKQLDSNGREVVTTRLLISDLPMYMPDYEVEEILDKLGVDQRSKVMYDRARDQQGRISKFKTGKRFAYIVVPEHPLPKSIEFGVFTPKLFYREQAEYKPRQCFKCLEQGHLARDCPNQVRCRTCNGSGHKAGDPECSLGIPPPPPGPAAYLMTSSGGAHWPNLSGPLTPLGGIAMEATEQPPLPPSPGVTAVEKSPSSVSQVDTPAPVRDSPSPSPESETVSMKRPASPPTPQSAQDPKRERGDLMEGKSKEEPGW